MRGCAIGLTTISKTSASTGIEAIVVIVLATVCGIMRSGQAIPYLEPDLDRCHARLFNARGDTLRSAVERKRVDFQPALLGIGLQSQVTRCPMLTRPTWSGSKQIDSDPGVVVFFNYPICSANGWPSSPERHDVKLSEEAPTTGETQ
jgi:hypothetical protein